MSGSSECCFVKLAEKESFQAKADGFGEIVEGSKLLGIEGERVRLKSDGRGPGHWKNLGAVLGNLDLDPVAGGGSDSLWSKSGTSDCILRLLGPR